MRTFKYIYQTIFIIVLFVVTSITINAQDIASNQNSFFNETAPAVIGINYEDISHNIEVYQKNNSYYLEMNGSLSGVFEGTIFDVEGKEIKVFEVNKMNKKQKFEIDMKDFEKGTYIIEVKQGQKKAYKRLYKTETSATF